MVATTLQIKHTAHMGTNIVRRTPTIMEAVDSVKSACGEEAGLTCGELELWLKDKTVIVHSYLYDAQFIDLPENTKDTMVMAYILNQPQSLKQLAKKLCGMDMDSYEDMVERYGKEKAMAYLERAALGPDGLEEFSYEAEADARDEGMSRAEAAANEEWKNYVTELIEWFALEDPSWPVYSANEINSILTDHGIKTEHQRAMGSLFAAAAKRGIIQQVGLTYSKQIAGHLGKLLTWKGIR